MTTPQAGISQRFRFHDDEQVEQTIEDLKKLRIRHLRVCVPDAKLDQEEVSRWLHGLIPRLGREFDLLLSVRQEDFLDRMIEECSDYIESIELFCGADEDRDAAPADRDRLCDVVKAVSQQCRYADKKMVLTGPRGCDPAWLQTLKTLIERDALAGVDVIGLRGVPGILNGRWKGWEGLMEQWRELLGQPGKRLPFWITEVGSSAGELDECGQLREFIAASRASVGRFYWDGLRDRPERPHGVLTNQFDARSGLRRSNGQPRLLYRLLEENGPHAVKEDEWMTSSPKPNATRRRRGKSQIVITGGAGFIGTNLAVRLMTMGHHVTVVDNLSRRGSIPHLRWLKKSFRKDVEVQVADSRVHRDLEGLIQRADVVFHLAAQTAVTTSLENPEEDMEVNLLGTFNLLNLARKRLDPPAFIFTSTNKVYGELADLPLREGERRYEPADQDMAEHGIGEDAPLAFHSPYGCSKGAADQYVLDFARSYGLPAVVFRMSCIYGPHQCGTEDQGWVAHFAIQALRDKPITLYGNGRQVRDLLYVEDLVNAFCLAWEKVDACRGQAFNIGGGSANTASLLEVVAEIERLEGRRIKLRWGDWRLGDQRYFVSDIRKFAAATGWTPQVSCQEGIFRLLQWLRQSAQATPRTSAP